MMEYDVIVVGSGPGGYVAAIRAAQLGKKVVCIDRRKEPGGTCLNVGCIPSKALLHSSELFWKMGHEAKQNGIEISSPTVNLATMMGRKQKIVSGFNEGILALFKKNGVHYIPGSAKFLNPTTLQVAGDPLTAKEAIILATGSEPIALPFLPFDEKRVVSSTGALCFEKVPSRLLIVGAGIIGVELGSVYSRLGSKVEFIEFLDKICPTLDESLSKELEKILTRQGMTFHLNSKVSGADLSTSEVVLRVGEKQFVADAVLVAIGRKPHTQSLNLEAAGITLGPKGFLSIDGQFRTSVPHIYAIGDLVDGPMLAHKASEEGVAVAEIIAGQTPKVDYLSIPNVAYTSPEVAAVGFTEAEAKAQGLTCKTASFPFKTNSRAKCTGEEEGFVKIIAEASSDKLLGIHILGAHASELIAAGAVALHQRLTALDLVHTPFAHPTLAEAIKEAAMALHKKAIHR